MTEVVTTHKRCGEPVEDGECPICGSVPQDQLVRERVLEFDENLYNASISVMFGFGVATLWQFLISVLETGSFDYVISAYHYNVISVLIGLFVAAFHNGEITYNYLWKKLLKMRMRELAGYQPYVDDSGEEVA